MFELWFDQNHGRVHVAHLFGFLWCGFDLFVFVLCLVSNVACVSCVRSQFLIHVVHFIVLFVCSIRLYLRLFVGGVMSYLFYLCLLTYNGAQHFVLAYVFTFLVPRVLFWFYCCYISVPLLYIGFMRIKIYNFKPHKDCDNSVYYCLLYLCRVWFCLLISLVII